MKVAVGICCRPSGGVCFGLLWLCVSQRGFVLASPCTFWAHMAHLTCRSTKAQKETKRMRALVHVVLTLQLAMWQHQHNLIMPLENPPRAQSWRLDIMLQTLRITGMKQVYFDSCAWGHHDPESMQPYLKPQCIAASVDLSPLERRCSCPGGRKAGVHERIEGITKVPGVLGRRSSIPRTVLSGQYPSALCHAWARLANEHVRRRQS